MDALGDTAFGSDYEHLLQHKEQEDQEAHISVLQFADSTIRVMDDNCHSDKKSMLPSCSYMEQAEHTASHDAKHYCRRMDKLAHGYTQNLF